MVALELLLVLPFVAAVLDLWTRRGVFAVAASATVIAALLLGSSPHTPLFRLDEHTLGLLVFISGIYLAVSLYSIFYMRGNQRLGWFWAWMDLFYGSMLVFVSADHWLLLAVGWGGLDTASWGLIFTYRDEEEMGRVGLGERFWGLTWLWTPSASALRAILTVEVGSASLLASLGMTAAQFGSHVSHWGTLSDLAAALLLMAAFAKAAQLPFTDWLMTAMSAPTPVSALLHSSTMVKAGPILLLKLGALMPKWAADAAFTVGIATALYGGLVALAQREPKVMLAASTASYLGLITAFSLKNPQEALWLIYAHGVAKATLFMAVGHAIHEAHSRTPEAYPLVAKAAMALALLTLAGLTPLGALAKEHADIWVLAFSTLTAGYVGKLLLRTGTEGTGLGPMALPYLGVASSAFLVQALPNPLWALALLGLALAYVPPPRVLYARLGLPLLYDLAVPRAFDAVKRAVAVGDRAVDLLIFRSVDVWNALAKLIASADRIVDLALHGALPTALAAASRQISKRNFDYWLYVAGTGVGVALALALVVLWR